MTADLKQNPKYKDSGLPCRLEDISADILEIEKMAEDLPDGQLKGVR